jgi:exosortase/archaeosortase family protein
MRTMNFKYLYRNSAYFIKFIGMFCLLYFGTKAIIGLTVPGGFYSAFVDRYFDYPALLRSSLLNGTRLLAGVFGFQTYLKDAYHVTMVNGNGVHLVYSCLGYGLFSFWIAFIFANNGDALKKAGWMLGGCVLIWLLNVIRISLVLIGSNQHWEINISLEQHTLFNIVVYIFIFGMIWFFHRGERLKVDG